MSCLQHPVQSKVPLGKLNTSFQGAGIFLKSTLVAADLIEGVSGCSL